MPLIGQIRLDKDYYKYKLYKRTKNRFILRVDESNHLLLSVPKRASKKLAEAFIIDNKKAVLKLLADNKKLITHNNEYKVILGKRYHRDEAPRIDPVTYLGSLFEKILLKYSFTFDTSDLRIKPLKSAWGICYSSKKITLNSKLIAFDESIIEYVIIHELCHLAQMNHSKEFWQLVEGYLPNYKKLRKNLKENSKKMGENNYV